MENRPLGQIIHFTDKICKGYIDNRISQDLHYDLTGVEGVTLRLVFCADKEDKKLTASDICLKLKINKATVSSTLKRIKGKGLIKTLTNPKDHRLKIIALTEKGEEMRKQIDAEFTLINAQMEKGFTPEEKEEMAGLLKKIRLNAGSEF